MTPGEMISAWSFITAKMVIFFKNIIFYLQKQHITIYLQSLVVYFQALLVYFSALHFTVISSVCRLYGRQRSEL